jgi:hypothetical protein
MSQRVWHVCLKCACKHKLSLQLLNRDVLFNIKNKLLKCEHLNNTLFFSFLNYRHLGMGVEGWVWSTFFVVLALPVQMVTNCR